ncbi:hypothetical protein RKE25_19905 [Dyella sp. BiH032]|uniref:hypothetical protein n=1 Tax=Dyella sp. BiH032 TaxID=3075430 RepID=UPI00289313E1|nr:hypothetical protein [Dyella sp. BiH032]WNL45650.1 hypothetical protein RKE25_19905 [Dyella sp. BiH032]
MDEVFDALIRRVHQCAEDGAVVTVKIDGERMLAGVPAVYTVVISGGRLSRDDFYRRDGRDIAELVQGALDYYQSARSR